MPSLGRVRSTALTGGTAPYVEGAATVKQLVETVTEPVSSEVADLRNQVAGLADLLKQVLEAKAEPVAEAPVEVAVEVVKETKGTKAKAEVPAVE